MGLSHAAMRWVLAIISRSWALSWNKEVKLADVMSHDIDSTSWLLGNQAANKQTTLLVSFNPRILREMVVFLDCVENTKRVILLNRDKCGLKCFEHLFMDI